MKCMSTSRDWRSARFSVLATLGTLLMLLGGLAVPALAQVDAPTADITDDGNVNILDISTFIGLLGTQAGEVGYREGLDLVPDGVIDFADLNALLGQFGQTGVETGGTVLKGRVFDGLGNPLPDVTVKVGTNTVTGTTDKNGKYKLDNFEVQDLGDTVITFNGSGASDPSPGGSTEYPTIPNKPIFINGGTETRFRDMSLPERDLTGSVLLDDSNSTANPDGSRTITDPLGVTVNNAGVAITLPVGCEVKFPDDNAPEPRLSITRVDPAMLPVPMPFDLSSFLFVTYQPGETEVHCASTGGAGDLLQDVCAAGQALCTEFDNTDGFDPDAAPITIGEANQRAFGADGPGGPLEGDGPFVAGITNGVFKPLAGCQVSPDGIKLLCGPLPEDFTFAWYHADIRPPTPCPRTTVVGTVRLNDTPMTPVAGASVSVPGVAPVTTRGDGTFSIPNVPAGPNGRFCFTNPFSIRASASQGANLGVSKFTPAVPGGTTDVGDIKFGIAGTVQGQVLKLTSVNPFVVTPLPGAEIDVDTASGDVTDANGRYSVFDVPSGGYNVDVFFAGFVPEPGGGSAFKIFDDSQSGSIDFDGAIQVRDFRFTGTGAVKVTVVDTLGNPVSFVNVDLEAFGGDLGGGFEAPQAFRSGFDFDGDGMVTLNGVPQGPCEVSVLDFLGDFPVFGTASCFVNQHGELVELTVEVVQPGDIDQVRVSQAISRDSQGVDTDVVEVKIHYADPLPYESFFDISVDLEFDTDRDQGTGAPSEISNISEFGSTDLGVELHVHCDLFNEPGGFTEDFCEVFDANHEIVPVEVELFPFRDQSGLDPQTLIMLINKDQLIAAGGNGPYNGACLFQFGFEFNIFDVVPNGGNVEVDPNGFDQVRADPLGDTFFGEPI